MATPHATTLQQLRDACSTPAGALVFPPVLTPTLAALLIDRTPGAIYHYPAAGKLKGAVRKRGKHLLIWRDRALALQARATFRLLPTGGIGLTDAEVNAAFNTPELMVRFPPMLAPDTLAKVLAVGRSTIYRWLTLGRLEGTYTRTTGGIRFHRNAVLLELFNGKDWL